MIGRYNITDALSFTGRIEYFSDPYAVHVIPITSAAGFSSGSSSAGLNYQLAENILLRFEGRTFFSGQKVYMRDNVEVKNSNTLTSTQLIAADVRHTTF